VIKTNTISCNKAGHRAQRFALQFCHIVLTYSGVHSFQEADLQMMFQPMMIYTIETT